MNRHGERPPATFHIVNAAHSGRLAPLLAALPSRRIPYSTDVLPPMRNSMSRSINKPALAAALTGSLLLSGSAFAATPLAQGYMLGADAATQAQDAKAAEAKCGAKTAEAKCGADKAKAAEGKCGEGKCGEGKCGADKAKPGAAKAAEGKCGADKAKAAEGKCGEGKCGGNA
jgi:uncharacterized low-complexity protein